MSGSPREANTTGASPGAHGASSSGRPPSNRLRSTAAPHLYRCRSAALPAPNWPAGCQHRADRYRDSLFCRSAGDKFVFRIENRTCRVIVLCRRFGLYVRHRGSIAGSGGNGSRGRDMSECLLGLAVGLGKLKGGRCVAKRLSADRTGDVDRIEIGERVNRRMRNCRAYRLRQTEHGRMDRAERRRDQMLLPAFGDRRLTREQGAEILKSDFPGDEKQYAAPMAIDAASLRRRRPSDPASCSLNATPQRFTAALHRVATMRQIFLWSD